MLTQTVGTAAALLPSTLSLARAGVAGTAAHIAVSGTEYDVQRPDRRCPANCRTIVVGRPDQSGEGRRGRHLQRRRSGDVRWRAARVSDRSECASRHSVGRHGPGEPAQGNRRMAAAIWSARSCAISTPTSRTPAKRLQAISASMSDNKEVFSQLPQVQQLALSAFLTGGLFFGLIPGFYRHRSAAVQHRDFKRAGTPGAAVLAGCAGWSAITRCRSLWTVRR